MKVLILCMWLLAFSFMGCFGMSTTVITSAGSEVKVVEQLRHEGANCSYVGTFTSKKGGAFDPTPLQENTEYAMNYVRNEAALRGATHIVTGAQVLETMSSPFARDKSCVNCVVVTAKGYRCEEQLAGGIIHKKKRTKSPDEPSDSELIKQELQKAIGCDPKAMRVTPASEPDTYKVYACGHNFVCKPIGGTIECEALEEKDESSDPAPEKNKRSTETEKKEELPASSNYKKCVESCIASCHKHGNYPGCENNCRNNCPP